MANIFKTLSVAILISLVSFVGYKYFMSDSGVEEVACTMEAKLCPDGSYVGRTGPECGFAACPSAVGSVWTSTSSPQANFSYPTSLSTSYITTVDWPPTIDVLDEDFSCIEAGQETERAGITSKETINGKEYCVTKESEGAAGNTYTKYVYAFWKEDRMVIITFSLRRPQCANYPAPQSTVCSDEQESFDLNSVIDKIATSVNLK